MCVCVFFFKSQTSWWDGELSGLMYQVCSEVYSLHPLHFLSRPLTHTSVALLLFGTFSSCTWQMRAHWWSDLILDQQGSFQFSGQVQLSFSEQNSDIHYTINYHTVFLRMWTQNRVLPKQVTSTLQSDSTGGEGGLSSWNKSFLKWSVVAKPFPNTNRKMNWCITEAAAIYTEVCQRRRYIFTGLWLFIFRAEKTRLDSIYRSKSSLSIKRLINTITYTPRPLLVGSWNVSVDWSWDRMRAVSKSRLYSFSSRDSLKNNCISHNCSYFTFTGNLIYCTISSC